MMRFEAVVLLALALLATPAAAADWTVGAAWTHADVGLHEDGDGLAVAVAGHTDLATSRFRLVYALEYVQKAGAQPTAFSDPVAGFVDADAEVTLHCLQPALLVEMGIGAGTRLPRPFLGLAATLKLDEAWSDFPGTPGIAYGYKDLDWTLLLGIAQALGPITVDLRYSLGLSGQLLVDNSGTSEPAAKAEDLFPGVAVPEVGAKLSYVQVGVRVAF